MDWSNESYVRVYTRETDDDLALSWGATALWNQMLKKFDRSGIIATRRGARGLAAVVRIPADVVERVLPELIADGRVSAVDQGFASRNFLDAQEAKKSDRLRQKETRERRRDGVTPRDSDVTNRDESVTTGHTESLFALPCLATPRLPVHQPPDSPAPAIGLELRPGTEDLRGSAERIRLERSRWCTAKWAEVNAHRIRIAARFGLTGVRELGDQDPGRTALQLRVRDGGERVIADVEHVIAVRVAEAEATKSVRWLGGGMFDLEGEQWRNALTMTPDDARRVRGAKPVAAPTARTTVANNDDDHAFIPASHRAAEAKP